MLIDNFDDSRNIRNVSYLIPVGICIYLTIYSVNNIMSVWISEWGIYANLDLYLNYWLSHSISLLFVVSFGYFFVRSLWRRIVSGQLNCSKVFISLFVLSIMLFGLAYLSEYVIRIFEESRYGTPKMPDNEYYDFIRNIYPYTWFVEFVIIILSITFATRGSGKQRSSEDY
ncbi:MAG: hypothetical protein AB8B56_02200 [Crocinitomicaceae bacterium]